jgi:hypothetical protein
MRRDRLEVVGEPVVQGLHDLPVPSLVDHAHPAQVAGEQAWSMKSARAAWVGSGVCQSARYLALRTAATSDDGVTRNPRRRVASRVLENEPT